MRRTGHFRGISLAGVFLSFMTLPGLRAEEWLRANSAHFEMYTTASEPEARQSLELFETVRDFLMRVKSSTTVLPVTIVGFRNQQEYDTYRLVAYAAAYYTGDERRDYIVMSSLANSRTAIHEYVHLLVRHSGLTVPVWLNEGFAEVYSTLQPRGGQILLGAIPPNHLSVLRQQRWMELPALFEVTHESPEYNEKEKVGIFYAQSWLLAHMLLVGKEYAAKFPAFVLRLSESKSADDAFAAVYGKTIVEVQADLESYVRRDAFDGILYKTAFQRMNAGPAREATELEVELTLARLAEFAHHAEEAAERLQRLAAAYPNRYEVEEALGELAWRAGSGQEAARHLRTALARGATNWRTYWDFAQASASAGGPTAERIQALRKTLALEPDSVDARLMLGQQLYGQNQYAQALTELRQIKTIDPQRAASMLLTMAYSALQLKQDRAAAQYADLARKYARTPEEKQSVEEIFRYLQQRNTPAP